MKQRHGEFGSSAASVDATYPGVEYVRNVKLEDASANDVVSTESAFRVPNQHCPPNQYFVMRFKCLKQGHDELGVEVLIQMPISKYTMVMSYSLSTKSTLRVEV